MADDTTDEDNEWLPRFRVDEELEFFTDLAFHETERWMQAVTKKKLSHPDDLRCALQNGVMLCELVNGLQPGSIPRINRHNTPIAGLDNLTLFLKACQQKFGLRQPQLFDPLDLEDLSQRAAFSDENPAFLKQETDRRLRNVALTVYWLGQVARELYSGPQLDQSAFSGLVTQNPGVLSPEQSPQRKSLHSPYSESSYTVTNSRNNFRGSNYLSNSRQSNNSVLNSSDYSNNSDQCLSTQSNTSDLIVSQRSSTISPHEGGHVASEASYDSNDLGSDGGLSIDPADMSRHGSTSNLSRWGHGDSPVYSSHDINNPMYRSSPNLAQGSHAHNLSSSTDSLDGGHGFHSRQSSGSMENYSTRRLSSTGRPSRPSVTSNPLQFIKAKGSSQLAQTAQKQIQIAEESKKIKWDTLMETTEDNDWQSKLGNWKSKRRTKSSTSYDQKEEEKEAIEKENEEKAQRSTKTFKEMVQERDRRKSMNSYPLEDENDEYTANNRSSDINHNRTESARSMQSSGSLDDSLAFDSSAPWAASSDDDTFKRDNRVGNGLPSESDTESNKENWTEQEESQINNNNTKYNKSSVSPKLSKEKNNEEQTMSNQKPKSNKLSNLLQAFEEQAESDIEYKAVSRRSAQKSTAITDQSSLSEEPKISPRSPRTDKDSVEKSITISQKPNSEKGFGFTFTGGRDLSQPIVVEKVSLGGAADVCEVRVKDEILEINRRKAATYSHTQVGDLIKRAVRTGKLELKVKRFIRKGSYLSDEFSEEDSFDRFEEQMEKEQEMKSNSRNERSGLTPMMDSLLREKHDHSADNGIGKWDEPMQEDELTDRQTGQGYEDMSYSPQPVEEEELHISNKRPVRNAYSAFVEPESNQSQVEEETEEEIEEDEAPSPEREPSPVQQSRNVLSSYKHSYTPYSPDSDYKPASVITAESGKPINFDVSLPVNQSSTPENNGFGPPTALLRWQRRPRSQYEKEQDEKTDHSANQTQFLVDINQSNSSTSKRMEDEQEIKPTVVPRGKLDLSREIKKMEDWDRKQEQKRQPDVTMPTEQNQEQREFEQNVEAINSRWESDQEKALTMEQEKRQKDEFILSEERKRVAEMEQRKAERRAQRQAQLAESSSQQVSRPSTLQQQVTRPQIEVTKGRPQPLESSELVLQIPGQGEYGGLQIDPLNRPDLTPRTLDGYSAVNFMLNLNQKPTGSSLASTNNAEVIRERERLQQEEVAMRRRIEEEKAADDRRLREREEQIKRQEERLRQEEERLRFEQERLQRERQQHLQTFNLTSQRGESPASLPKLSPSYPSSSPSSLSPPFNSQPEADQQFSSTVVIAKASPNNYYVKSVQQAPYQSPFSSSALNKREDKASERLTREDLMAMSRSARPLEEKPPSLQQEEQPVLQTTVVPVKTAVSQPTPMVREAPSKQEKHSLNAVPRSRLQDSKGWIEQRQEDRASPKQAAPRPARRSDIMKKQYTSSQDHWLVQEAERRRLEEQNYNGQRPSSRQYITGPIKPHESLTTNRWRETGPHNHPSKAKNNLRSSTSFEQMRQKFSEQPKDPQPLRATNAALQPRAAPRQIPSGPVSAREDSLGWQTKNSANPAYMGRNGSREGEMVRSSPKPAPRSRSTPAAPGNSPEPTMAVSGRQRCSHCEEELGYGAAMVIESLNLHYHMQCFRCCVCRTQLGNGAEGADVRVRGWKLHCRNCYSNDEAGLKFSKV